MAFAIFTGMELLAQPDQTQISFVLLKESFFVPKYFHRHLSIKPRTDFAVIFNDKWILLLECCHQCLIEKWGAIEHPYNL